MTAPLRAGLVGVGMMGRNHARVLSSLDGVELVAIADPGGDPHQVAGGRELLGSVDELIQTRVDYVVVACPTALHLEVGLALAEAGVHALIEKPLADTAEGARKLAEAFDASGLVGAVGHIERYNPALQNARRRLAEGELGEVYQVVTRRQGPFPGRIADVGVVKDLATHDIDLTAWVTQRPYVSVAAQTAHRSGRPHEDLVAFVGSLEGGLVASHLINWLSPMKERVTVITGERGTFVADTLTADLTFYGNGNSRIGVGRAGELPRCQRGRHDSLRDSQAGAASGGARAVPRRCAGPRRRHRDDAAGPADCGGGRGCAGICGDRTRRGYSGVSSPRILPSADIDSGAQIGDGTTVWHLAQVRAGAVVGANCIIGRGAYIGDGATLGDNCKVQNYALVYEPATLGDGVFVGPAAVLTNDEFPRAVNADGSPKDATDWQSVGVEVGEGASIGARAVCVAPVRIGAWATVAAGAVVTRDVPDFALVVGVPARRVGWVGRAGLPLAAAGDGLWTCGETGERYVEEGEVLKPEAFS